MLISIWKAQPLVLRGQLENIWPFRGIQADFLKGACAVSFDFIQWKTDYVDLSYIKGRFLPLKSNFGC